MSRKPGIDIARGIAVLLMIETHAYDGWVSAAGKQSFAYHLSRVLSSIPASLFLMLAGVGMAMGAHAALRRGEAADAVRRRLGRRGLEIVGWGYLVSLAYQVIEGTLRPSVLLRADILHCIGLSMVVCALALIGRSHLPWRALALGAAAIAVGIAAHPLVARAALPMPLAVVVGLFVDVAPYTRFPLCPLIGYVAAGVALGQVLLRWEPRPRLALCLAAGLIGVAWLATWGTQAMVAAIGGALSRSHPAVTLNMVNGAARSLAVVCLSIAAAPLFLRGPRAGMPALVRLGRGSLLAYALHIPFCYGRLAEPLAHRLHMGEATVAVIGLTLLTYGAVWARDRHAASKGAVPRG